MLDIGIALIIGGVLAILLGCAMSWDPFETGTKDDDFKSGMFCIVLGGALLMIGLWMVRSVVRV